MPKLAMVKKRGQVSVVMTIKNDPVGCDATLRSLANQARPPDEIIVVDGGSTDGTIQAVLAHSSRNPGIRLIQSPGANIARGRNIGTEAASGEIIATIDAGCRAERYWLANLTRPFDEDTDTEFVAGFYAIETHTLLEEVVGLATMRGQLEPVDPKTFNPSARSMAYTKSLWSRAGGWPDWVRYSEDTLFDHRIRRMGIGWRFAGDAVVHWRPRVSLRAIARQFYNYGTGRGHTQIDAPSFAYNLRNVLIVLLLAALCLLNVWVLPVLVACLFYFYVWTFHDKSMRIARRTRRRLAYPLCQCVMWIVLASNLTGYLVGSWQRWRSSDRYRRRTELYLAKA